MKEYVLNEKKEIFATKQCSRIRMVSSNIGILQLHIIMELEMKFITAHKTFINPINYTLDAEL